MNRTYTLLIGLMLCLGFSRLAAQTPPTGLTATIPGSFAVSASGAATYQIPIDLPAGAGGLTPRLSLSYNSLAGLGLAGQGWNLSGLSAITRVGKDIAHDGVAAPVTFTNQDPLVLDGNRMVVLSGAHLTAGTVYGTEQEGFVRIEAIADGATVWFRVTQKDGTVMEYGSTAASRYTPTGAAAPYQWWLRRVTTLDGNYYEVEYKTENSQIVPSVVRYSSNALSVEFGYSNTPQAVSYQGGASFTHEKRLDNITVKVGASDVRKYNLAYEPGLGGIVQLNSVALTVNGTANALPQATFVWEKSSFQNTTIPTNLPSITPYYGDFDGNGSTDVAKISGGNVVVYKWNGSNFDSGTSIPLSSTPFKSVYTPDLDGDGRADLVGYYLNGTIPTCKIYQNNGSQMVFRADIVLTGYSGRLLQFGDINGDNKTDLIWDDGVKINFWLFSDFTAMFGTKIPYTSSLTYVLRDFNGDGKCEVLSTAMLSYTNGAIVSSPVTMPYSKSKFSVNFPGDFNGDGLCDMFYLDRAANQYKIKLFDGVDFNGSMPVDIRPWNGWTGIYVGDFDGDGADDIIFQSGDPDPGLYSYSPKLRTQHDLYLPSSTFYFDPENLADFDGDGGVDLLFSPAGASMQMLKFSDQALPRRIKTISRGDGFSYGVAYANTRDANLCSRTFGTSYPLANFAAAQFLVSTVTTPDGIGGTRSRTYRYGNPTVHLGGLGYLGVETFEETDEATGTKVTQTFSLNNARYQPQLTRRTVAVGGTPVSTETYAYAFKNLSLGRYVSYASGVTSVDELKGVTTKASYLYDDYGNLTYERKSSGVNFVVATTYSGFTGPVSVAPGFPTTIRTSYLQGRGVTREVNTTLTYTDRWKVLTQAQDGAPTKTFTYGAFGNVTKVEETGSGVTRFTTFAYDPTGRFLTGTTNAKNHSITSVINATTGTVTNTSDANGYKTEYLYDALGRPTTVTGPDGSSVSYAYSWAVNEIPNAVRKTVATATSAGTTTEWYDMLGRVIQKSSPAPGGKTVVVSYTYSEKGELLHQSLPGFTNPSSERISFTYDAYGRVTRKDAPGKSVTYAYSGSSVTEAVVGGQSSTVMYNEIGLPAEVRGDNGSVLYTYNGLGQPVDVTAAGVKTTSYTYDYAASKQTVTNLNAGTSTVTSNAWGQPVTVTDARGNHTTFAYDALGRLQAKTLPEGAVTYTYDRGLKGVLNQVTFGNHTRTFGYNAAKYGRLESVIDNIGGRFFSRRLAYDDSKNGRLQAVTYPNGVVVTYGYDASGFTSAIAKGDNSPIWTRGEENALGQPVSYTLGNGLQQRFSYNTSDHTIESVGAAGVYSQSYKVNAATGNLEWRRDNRAPALREDFTYDAADRLKTITGTQGSYTMDYSGNGNIDQKPDAGTYSYGLPLHPHAVSEVAPAAGSAVPTLKQNVSYSSFNKPTTITEASGKSSLTLAYGVDLERVKEETYTLQRSRNFSTLNTEPPVALGFPSNPGIPLNPKDHINLDIPDDSTHIDADPTPTQSDSALIETRYLLGDYEVVMKNGVEKHYCYVSSPYGVVAVNISEGTAIGAVHYLHTDYLGSVVAISNASGVREQEMSFDAWGRRRNPENWSYTELPDPTTYLINRGYTFHEHYDKLGLINMNGRVYDPIVGRFLSVDPVVSDPLSAQSYNGYSYCVNNPLKYTDPSGYISRSLNPGCGFGGTGSPTFGEYGSSGGSGFGGDPCHVGDYFYDYTSSTYRTSDAGFGQVSFGEVNSNYVSRYGYSGNTDKFKQYLTNLQYQRNSGLIASLGGVGKSDWRWLRLGTGKPYLEIRESPSSMISNYHGGYHELDIKVYGDMFSDYNWVQTVSYNNGAPFNDPTEMVHNGFFYGDKGDSEREALALQKQGDADMFFWDAPNATTFEAELTLFGNKGGRWEVIQSFSWGYSVGSNGNTTFTPLHMINNPSGFHQQYVIISKIWRNN